MNQDTDSVALKDIAKVQVDDIKVLYENGVNIVLGTDTGDIFALPGIALQEEIIVRARWYATLGHHQNATLNAAKMMKADKDLGSIEEGKIADMLLLDKNLLKSIYNMMAIKKVFKNGKEQERIKS